MRKLHMGTMSYGADSMDEVAHQLALAFGASGENGKHFALFQSQKAELLFPNSPFTRRINVDWNPASDSWSSGYVISSEGCRS